MSNTKLYLEDYSELDKWLDAAAFDSNEADMFPNCKTINEAKEFITKYLGVNHESKEYRENNMKFAKLFNSTKVGQILVLNSTDEPKVEIHFKPECLGVCNIGMEFNKGNLSEEDQYEKADEYFSKITLDNVEPVVIGLIDKLTQK